MKEAIRLKTLIVASLSLISFLTAVVFIIELRAITQLEQFKKACSEPSETVLDSEARNIESAIDERLKNVVYVKTGDKNSSWAIQNILFRFCENNGLIIVPPNVDTISFPEPLDKRAIPDPTKIKSFSKSYSMLVHQTVFSHEQLSQLMPKDSIYFTVLSNPSEQFKTLAKYFHLRYQVIGRKKTLTINDFVDVVLGNSTTGMMALDFAEFARNQMSYDLGMVSSAFEDEQYVDSYIKYLESVLHFVGMADRMDETLVLLKHLLNWTTDDIVVFKKDQKIVFDEKMNQTTIDALSVINRADIKLYEHFSEKFDEKVRTFGVEKMATEVQELRSRTFLYQDMCSSEELSEKMDQFCTQFALSTNMYTERLVTMQAKYFVDFYNLGIVRRMQIAVENEYAAKMFEHLEVLKNLMVSFKLKE